MFVINHAAQNNLRRCAYNRANIAWSAGDHSRYWRELATADRIGAVTPSITARYDRYGHAHGHAQ